MPDHSDLRSPDDDARQDEGPCQGCLLGHPGAAKLEFMEGVTADFNASQDKDKVVFESMGSYSDLLAKGQGTDPGGLPAMLNGSDAQHKGKQRPWKRRKDDEGHCDH